MNRGRRGKKHKKANLASKYGTCKAFRSPKTKYWNWSVANFDRIMMAKKFPDDTFEAFKCKSCNHWHIGTAKHKN